MCAMKDDSRDIITTVNYDEENPVYQKIKKKFTNKLKDKFECEDYEGIVKYVFDYVFQKRSTKQSCIENLNSIFNDKAAEIMDFLWKTTREAEKEQKELNESDEDSQERFGGRGGFNKRSNPRNDRGPRNLRNSDKGRSMSDRVRKGSKDNKFYSKNKRERSRSGSRSRDNKYDYDAYPNYPPQPKGFYPPKGRFNRPMMQVSAPYPPYYPPSMMNPYMNR